MNMSKLLFQDDSGNNFEINLSSIKSEDLHDGDSIIARYEVGDAPSKDVQFALAQLKDMLQGLLPQGVKVVVLAVRNGKGDIELQTIKNLDSKNNIEKGEQT